MITPPDPHVVYIALHLLPDGRVAGVRRHDDGWSLECGEVWRPFACALDAFHALGTWQEREGARAERCAEIAV